MQITFRPLCVCCVCVNAAPDACWQLKKGESLPSINVWLVDLATLTWSAVKTSGKVPCARGGHSVRDCRCRQCGHFQQENVEHACRRATAAAGWGLGVECGIPR